jgi:hypothetical protein
MQLEKVPDNPGLEMRGLSDQHSEVSNASGTAGDLNRVQGS